VRDIIEDAGFRTKEAASADEALQVLCADGINLVLTDVEMPGSLDGLALAQMIRMAAREGDCYVGADLAAPG
jgi:two-component system, response regulator PdtaR